MEYVEAHSLGQVFSAFAEFGEGAKVVAGGVALNVLMRYGLVKPDCLVSIRYLPDLAFVREDGAGAVGIGAATTHRAIETSSLIRARLPALAEMERGLASVQVRNAGTIGGNLCHADPAEDPAPVLLAYGAESLLASAQGRRRLPLARFFKGYLETALAPGEILVELVVPPPPPRSATVYLKHTTRNAVDFPLVGVAAQMVLGHDGVTCEDVRVVMGAVAPTPVVSAHVPTLLRGNRLTPTALHEAGRRASEEADPADDVFGSAEFRRHLVTVLTRRALAQAWERARAA